MSAEENGQANFVRVGSVGDYEDGRLYNHKIEERYYAVVRSGERFYAMRNACTHAGFLLTPGELYEGRIHCPAHGAFFNLEDGEPTAGPADDSLDMCEVRVEGGDVFIAPLK